MITDRGIRLLLIFNSICSGLMFVGTIWRTRLHWMHPLGFFLWLALMTIAWVPLYRYTIRRFLPVYERLGRICVHVGMSCSINTRKAKFIARLSVINLFLCACSEIARVSVPKAYVLAWAAVGFENAFVGAAIYLVWTLARIQDDADVILGELESGRVDSRPPRAAKFLLLLIPRRHREYLVGDLEEEYSKIVLPEYGLAKARLWYWWQVLASMAPLIWAETKRLIGLVVIWKSVR